MKLMKNEVTVGITIVLGILLAVVGAVWLTGQPFGEEQVEIAGIFREVGELREGNPVKYRGVEVGRVTGIQLGEAGVGVVVTMLVSPDVVVPDDPAILLASASLFGDWQAAIVSRTDWQELEFTQSQGGNVLPGATLPDITQLTAVGAQIAENLQTLAQRVDLAFTEETAIKMRETIDNVQAMSEQLTGFVDQQTQTYRDVSENILVATENISTTTSRVGQIAEDVGGAFAPDGEIQQILTNARQASENLERLSVRLEEATSGVPTLVARTDTTLADLGQLASSASAMLETLEPQIAEVGPTMVELRETLEVLGRVGARLEGGDGTLGRLIDDPALFEEMQATIATMRRILADLQANPARYIGEVRIF